MLLAQKMWEKPMKFCEGCNFDLKMDAEILESEARDTPQ